MKRFEYRAATRIGDVSSDILHANNRNDAARILMSKGMTPIRISEVKDGVWAKLNRDVSINRKLPSAQLCFATRQLSALLDADLNIEQALSLTVTQSETKVTKRFLTRLLQHVREGHSLYDALRMENSTPDFYNGIVRAGEQSGTLKLAFADLTEYLSRTDEVTQKMLSALIYPAIVLATVCFAIFIVLCVVVPEFEPVFRGQEDQLPAPTQAVLALSRMLQSHGLMLFAGLLAAVFALLMTLKVKRYRARLFEFALIKLPVARLYYFATMAQVLRVFGSMLRAGVPLANALELSGSATKNAVIQAELSKAAIGVREGSALHSVLARSSKLPITALYLLRVGEETAQLGDLATKAASIIAAQTRNKIDRLVALLNPLSTVVLGVIVAGLVAAVMLGILSVNNLAR
ncbi:MAG: type II secretion system F family protein [Pseudomonadota bacterium]